MKPPGRRFEVELKIGGDLWEDVLWELERLLGELSSHGPACSSVSGGHSSYHIVTVTEDASMTHERFSAAIQEWAAQERAEALGTKA
jgi:hypothetical protein